MQVTNSFNFSNVVIEHEQAVTLMVRVKAPPSPQQIHRKPLNLSLVLDRSGSMGGDKLAHLRVAACQLVNQLTPRDRLSVVTFDDVVLTIVPPAPATNKVPIRKAIEGITAEGSTNLSGGWLEGLRHVAAGQSEDSINRVLLLTDGLANQGITEPAALREIARQHRAGRISTTTLGFGADFDEQLLSRLADDGGGAFYFIENPDDAPAAFAEELGELLAVVGQNLTIEINARPPVRLLSVLNDFPIEPTERGARIRAGDLFGEELREILAVLHIPGLPELGPRQVGEVIVDLDQVVEPIMHHHLVSPVEVHVVAPEHAQAEPDPEIQSAATILAVNKIRDKVIQMINAGCLEEAEAFIAQFVAQLESEGQIPVEVRIEIERLREDLAKSRDRPEYGSKPMFFGKYRSGRGKGDYRKY